MQMIIRNEDIEKICANCDWLNASCENPKSYYFGNKVQENNSCHAFSSKI